MICAKNIHNSWNYTQWAHNVVTRLFVGCTTTSKFSWHMVDLQQAPTLLPHKFYVV